MLDVGVMTWELSTNGNQKDFGEQIHCQIGYIDTSWSQSQALSSLAPPLLWYCLSLHKPLDVFIHTHFYLILESNFATMDTTIHACKIMVYYF